jgi:hypothetical protein
MTSSTVLNRTETSDTDNGMFVGQIRCAQAFASLQQTNYQVGNISQNGHYTEYFAGL